MQVRRMALGSHPSVSHAFHHTYVTPGTCQPPHASLSSLQSRPMASAATASQPQGASKDARDMSGLAKTIWGQQVHLLRCTYMQNAFQLLAWDQDPLGHRCHVP